MSEDKSIVSYVNQERARCAALSKAIRDEPNFLLYCIEHSVYPDEIEDHRSRFEQEQPVDEFEDLM